MTQINDPRATRLEFADRTSRADLLARVAAARPVLEATALEAERLGSLPPAAVEALHDIGIYRLKAPVEIGGFGADPLTQHRVFAAVAESNPSAGWCAFVGAGAGNVAGGFLPDAGIDTVFGGDRWPGLAGVLAPSGVCTPVPGGFEVSGRWAYVSGVRHVDWICLGARRSDGDEGRMIVVPIAAVDVQDDWATCGLQGTGSNSIVLDGVFVPDSMSWDPALPPRRGGPGTRMGIGGNFAPETTGFALGVARRALDEVRGAATVRKRGGRGVALADRGAFLLELGRRQMQYDAVQALAESQLSSAWSTAEAVGWLPEEHQARLRAMASYCVEACAELVRALWPFLGASELQIERALQRCLRDLLAMTQHYHVSNVNFETFAASLLRTDADR